MNLMIKLDFFRGKSIRLRKIMAKRISKLLTRSMYITYEKIEILSLEGEVVSYMR